MPPMQACRSRTDLSMEWGMGRKLTQAGIDHQRSQCVNVKTGKAVKCLLGSLKMGSNIRC
ncbi:MAG TPA: hypothetical protein DDX19_01415 [Rhodopirellula baltica]|uniref:Uncharacterized protein n=1 Tax=Rhodopirellula baltica (strain DSM 10527 / NCIMB 13988 / SH1) TaxID=243090 RepID=Q7UXU6_RHOBA|nr:hypothetical protein RB1104 [Rhodopirellula baltica SH 1]HBE61436.1 hypothetical protein [Rhodopirellula baltica]